MTTILRGLGFTLFVACVAIVALETDRSLPLIDPDAPSPASTATPPPPLVRLLFGGGTAPHEVLGILRGVSLEQLTPLGASSAAFAALGPDVRFSFTTHGDDLLGFAVAVGVPMRPLHWALTLDGSPFPESAFFAGPFGLPAPELAGGIGPSCMHGFASGSGTPYFSRTAVGAFVICSR